MNKKEKALAVTRATLGTVGGIFAATAVCYALNAVIPYSTFNIAKRIIVKAGIASVGAIVGVVGCDVIADSFDTAIETVNFSKELCDEAAEQVRTNQNRDGI